MPDSRDRRCPGMTRGGVSCAYPLLPRQEIHANRKARRLVALALGRKLTTREFTYLAASEVWHKLRAMVVRNTPVALQQMGGYDLPGAADAKPEVRVEDWLERGVRLGYTPTVVDGVLISPNRERMAAKYDRIAAARAVQRMNR